MSSRDLFEDGDTGEAILPVVKVNDKGAHADRDGSEAPRAENPLHEMPEAEGAEGSVAGRVTLMVSLTDIDRGDLLAWIIGAHPAVFDDAVKWLVRP